MLMIFNIIIFFKTTIYNYPRNLLYKNEYKLMRILLDKLY